MSRRILTESVEYPQFPGVGWWVSPIARLTSQKKGQASKMHLQLNITSREEQLA